MSMHMPEHAYHPVIIGAGPAGLAAAYEATQRNLAPLVLEKANQVGGLARTELHQGYRFDIGGHRFFTKIPDVEQLWQQLLGEDLLTVPRYSRIFYGGRFFKYPLELFDALSKLSLAEGLNIAGSYLRARLRPYPQEETFEQWMVNRFGRRLYETFFQTYTEKVWGIPAHQIQADWAAQRIQGLSLRAVLSNALLGSQRAKTLIRAFLYPTLGSGMMWQQFRKCVESRGGLVQLNSEVVRLERDAQRIRTVVVHNHDQVQRVEAAHIISSMPLADLLACLAPLPPREVMQAAQQLRHRDFILVGLIANRQHPFPDQWIYIHDPGIQAGRIQNFGNWSAALAPDSQTTCLGVEYFCTRGDALWQMTDAALLDLAGRELAQLGLLTPAELRGGIVIRQPQAYPVYDGAYRTHLATIRRFLATLENVQTIGRNGMHRYNNMDHAMLTGMLAVANLSGESHNLWHVNTESIYHEQSA